MLFGEWEGLMGSWERGRFTRIYWANRSTLGRPSQVTPEQELLVYFNFCPVYFSSSSFLLPVFGYIHAKETQVKKHDNYN